MFISNSFNFYSQEFLKIMLINYHNQNISCINIEIYKNYTTDINAYQNGPEQLTKFKIVKIFSRVNNTFLTKKLKKNFVGIYLANNLVLTQLQQCITYKLYMKNSTIKKDSKNCTILISHYVQICVMHLSYSYTIFLIIMNDVYCDAQKQCSYYKSHNSFSVLF